ncbi:hypothetical protein [Metabacillus sp. Hm71]
MYKMKFHWEKDDKTGSFTVEAMTVEQCIEMAEEEIKNGKAEMVDWYVI